MKVPKGKEIWIGNKKYKAGKELPANYNLPEKKKQNPKKESDNK